MKTDLFTKLDNVIGNHMDGNATINDLLKVVWEVNRYLIEHPPPTRFKYKQSRNL